MIAKNKMMAIFIVALMTVSSVAVMFTGGSDADDGLERIDLDPLEIPDGFEEKEILLEGEDGPMLLGDTRATGVLEGLYPGSWTWDRTTGIGPYNSFYGAFDIDDGNRFVGVLNPYNLKQLVDGTPLSTAGHYNIMWVLPTVYWSVDANGNLELSNDPTKGTAYAHTVDGHTYKYIAYGVYEGTPNASTPTMLTSESGKSPVVSKAFNQFVDLGSVDLSEKLGPSAWSMIINFYQWELYKYVCYTLMEDFNSQTIVGNGQTYSVTSDITGQLDEYGPYAGRIGSSGSNGGDPVKLFIENMWGTRAIILGGVLGSKNTEIKIDPVHKPATFNPSQYLTTIEWALPSSGFGLDIMTDEKVWGIPSATGGNAIKGTADDIETSTSMSSWYPVVGGSNSTTYWQQFGISYAKFDSTTTASSNNASRIMFVFDNDVTNLDLHSYDYKLIYDSSLMATTTAAISVDGMDPISHEWPTFTITIESNDVTYGTVDTASVEAEYNSVITVDGPTLTIGETTVTATPSSTTEQYSYVFDGWYLNGSELESGYVVDSALTITATFEQLEPVTVTLDAGSGTISGSTELQVFVGQPIGELPTPTRKNYEFTGWYDANNNKVTPEYIVPDADFTLTAHYELDEALQSIDKIVKILPIIIILGLLIGIAAAIFYSQRYGMDIQSLIPIMIGASVGVIVFAVILMPILNNMW